MRQDVVIQGARLLLLVIADAYNAFVMHSFRRVKIFGVQTVAKQGWQKRSVEKVGWIPTVEGKIHQRIIERRLSRLFVVAGFWAIAHNER
jgi:hydrogenase maturation factor